MWHKKSGTKGLDLLDPRQLLRDAELMTDGKRSIAALVLLGTRKAMGRYLGQAEVIFEYRSSEAQFLTSSESNIGSAFLAFWIRCGR